VPDPVFDPILANVATADPGRAQAEVQGIFGSGAAIASAYSSEYSLIRSVLFPPNSVDPTTQAVTLVAYTPTP
jgi:hypothetical protein